MGQITKWRNHTNDMSYPLATDVLMQTHWQLCVPVYMLSFWHHHSWLQTPQAPQSPHNSLEQRLVIIFPVASIPLNMDMACSNLTLFFAFSVDWFCYQKLLLASAIPSFLPSHAEVDSINLSLLL